jgi:23S rRNA (cytidine1920-2'-O)/16S rRNA (cytidine1409-2'-O)-methyltransferase
MKERIDKLLLERGLARSRQQAQALILAGEVLADEKRIDKSGMKVDSEALLRLKNPAPPYVSRAGLKLEKALAVFASQISGWVCLDIGASTGGFTDCLLQHGASHVYAIDVGHNQLDWKIRSDPRVVSTEGLNARYLKFLDIGVLVDLITIDVSFISLTLILPVLPDLLKPGGMVICLIKPQFEVGKGEVGKGGLVRDPRQHQQVVHKIQETARQLGFAIMGSIESPIAGMEGNKEFLLALKR